MKQIGLYAQRYDPDRSIDKYTKYDRDGNEISGVLKAPAVAFIIESEDKLYIEDVQLYENIKEVPKEYK